MTRQPPAVSLAYGERQGNGVRETAPVIGDIRDDIGDPRPGDPWWRSRHAHRASTPEAMRALRSAREARGWTMTRAAAETGVSRPMISLLERGLRRPSASLARALIDGYDMDCDPAGAVREIALEHVGRDSPYRTGQAPGGSWEPRSLRETGQNPALPGKQEHTARGRQDAPRAAAGSGASEWIAWARAKAEAAACGRPA